MYENGLWLNDGSQPEFCLENREEWFFRYGSIGNQSGFHILACMAVAILGGGMFWFLFAGDVGTLLGDFSGQHHQSQAIDYHLREKPGMKKDF